MSITVISADWDTLPNELLAAMKQHLRVDNTFDDVFIEDAIRRAIDHFQRVTEITVFATEYLWEPDAPGWCGGTIRSPITPINDFAAEADGSDVSADYGFSTNSLHGVLIYYLHGPYAAGVGLTLTSGYPSADLVPPGMRDVIFRLAATLFENREILVPSGQFLTPGWLEQVMGPYWLPRA